MGGRLAGQPIRCATGGTCRMRPVMKTSNPRWQFSDAPLFEEFCGELTKLMRAYPKLCPGSSVANFKNQIHARLSLAFGVRLKRVIRPYAQGQHCVHPICLAK